MSEKKPSFIHPQTVHIYTDGSYRPEGNAGCAYLLFSEKTKHVLKASRWACRGMTINQMELMAINKALDHPNLQYVIIYSDSQYTLSCLSIWYKSWEKSGWLNKLGEPIKNKELIQEILEKTKKLKFVKYVKVSAHSGDPFNSTVDYLVQGLTKKMVEDPNLPDGEYPV